jgi:hypothetical protein
MLKGCIEIYGIEDSPAASCSPPLAGFPVRKFNRSIIRSLTPQQAAGNALAIAVQEHSDSSQLHYSNTPVRLWQQM